MNAFGSNFSPALQRLGEVSVLLSVELGRTDMALRDVIALREGSVVSLDRLTDELLDITANGQVIAQGEVIAQDGKFALRIVNLANGEENRRSAPPKSSRPRPDAPSDAVEPAGQPDGLANADGEQASTAQTSTAQAPEVDPPEVPSPEAATPEADAPAADAPSQEDAV